MKIFTMSRLMTAALTIGLIAVGNRFVPGFRQITNG